MISSRWSTASMADSESEIAALRRAAETARSLLSGDMHPLEGARAHAAYSHEVPAPFREALRIFVGIADDSDAWPLGALRDHCSAAFLDRADREIAADLADNGPYLRAACAGFLRQVDGYTAGAPQGSE